MSKETHDELHHLYPRAENSCTHSPNIQRHHEGKMGNEDNEEVPRRIFHNGVPNRPYLEPRYLRPSRIVDDEREREEI